jgi:hypothetical protein
MRLPSTTESEQDSPFHSEDTQVTVEVLSK